MAELPGGTVTFLLTDVEGSTALWEQAPEAMRTALARHDALFEQAIREHGGVHIRPRGEGDSRFAVFAGAPEALAAALKIQRAFATESWTTPRPIAVRIGIHTGQAQLRDGDYYGSAVNRCARLRGIGHGGQVLLSEATTALVRDDLPAAGSLLDLGEHRLKDLSRPEPVHQLIAPGLPVDFPPLVSLDARPHNLPLQMTPLLGRDQEVRAVRSLLLRDDVRLVTLTGPGGTGKTRLSLQVAADLLDRFEDGAFLVELAPISDPALVVSAIAQVLGVRDTSGRPLLDVLVDSLWGRQLLLVLDNFEQVLSAATVADTLLRACPRLCVLVTSRAALQLRGEHEYPVPPLALPDSRRAFTPEALSQYGAVALFIERATAIKPDFVVTNANAPAVAEICARLDGLPLAIELAAARIRLLSPEAMLARLGHGLVLLTGGRRDLPARQQTLRGTIAWSYDLLPEAEQRLFRQLGVFVGGFTLDAAEVVSSTDSEPGPDVFDGVATLVDNSLIRPEDLLGVESRFRTLETIREYALELLATSGEAEALRRRHIEYYLELVESLHSGIEAHLDASSLGQLEREHDNLRSALTWAPRVASDLEARSRLAGGLWMFWWQHGHFGEARQWLERALSEPSSRAVRARAIGGAGAIAFYQGDFERASACLEESLVLWQQVGDRRGIAWVLHRLGLLCQSLGDYDRGAVLCAESVTLWRELGDRLGLAYALVPSAIIAQVRGESARAIALAEESVALCRAVNNRSLLAYPLQVIGIAASDQGDHGRARAVCEESLEIFRELGERWGSAQALRYLMLVAQRQGDRVAAIAFTRECLLLLRELGNLGLVHECAERLAWMASMDGRPEHAARLLGAAEAVRAAVGRVLPPAQRADHDEVATASRAVLGEEAFAAAWAEGRAMTLEQATTYALKRSAIS